MSSTFFGFNIAKSGLFASQRALDITGHNIVNANTPGYARQRLQVVQAEPMVLPSGQGMLGAGVDTKGIEQIRDQFLDFKLRKENTTFGEWEIRGESLQQIEAIFNEPSNSGIRQVMDDFFAALHELNNNPDNLTTRAQVRERGIALTKTVNHMYSQLQNMQRNTDFAIRTTVDQINGYASQIAELNQQIFHYELDGSRANDLRDQRNLAIDELSKLIDLEVQEIPVEGEKNNAGTVRILVKGIPLVSDFKHKTLTVNPRAIEDTANAVDVPNLLNITWEDGSAFTCRSGKLKGLLDIRDNLVGSEKGIPYYMDRLNRFTTVFAARFNMQHGMGYGLSGAGNHNAFFNGPKMDYTAYPGTGFKEIDVGYLKGGSDDEKIRNFEIENPGKTIFKDRSNNKWYSVEIIEANRIDISDAVKEDLNQIAAALNKDEEGDGLPGDGSNALKLNDLRHDVSMFTWGSPDDFFKALVSNLGVDSQEAIRMTENQKVLVTQIDNKRQSISGVSLDEEISNLVRFQHAYNASARMITTIDEMLDKIINGMGVSGR